MRATALLTLLGAASAAAVAPSMLPEPVIAARAAAALLGGFIGDAAAMPLHWIYDVSHIAQLVGSGEPEFFNPPSCPFYTYQPGWSTPYGQQFASAHLATGADGGFPPTALETRYFATYKPGGPAAQGGWYQDKSTKEFVQNEQAGSGWPRCGGDDSQADALVHVLPVVALYAGTNTSAWLQVADAVIRVTQNSDAAAAFGLAGARILEKLLIFNISGYAAVQAAVGDLTDPARAQPYAQDAALAAGLVSMLQRVNQSNMDVVLSVGQSCDYPNNLWTGAHLAAQLGGSPADYASAIRQTILAGGDSGSRSFFVGAMQAARLGDAALLPAGWAARASQFPDVATQVAQLVGHRAAVVAPSS